MSHVIIREDRDARPTDRAGEIVDADEHDVHPLDGADLRCVLDRRHRFDLQHDQEVLVGLVDIAWL